MYAYMHYIYEYMAIYTLAHSPCCKYIHMQHETLNNCMQATDTAGSSNQHSITIQRIPLDATAGFYQETSR